ncbi:MAG: hypothetical protein LC754_00850 [Acidobacteria bacterium]|nr:hypothetical protein [Acidobacteriota bacterium]
MRLQRLGGWFLIVFALTQVFRAISLEATTRNTTGIAFAFLVSAMVTTGAVLLWRDGQVHSKA